MQTGLWIVAADRLGAVVTDDTGAEIARALAPALPDRPVPAHEVSARDRLVIGAMAVKLRAWLLAERAAGRFDRLAVVAVPDVLPALRFRLKDGLSDCLLACVEAEIDPANTAAVTEALAPYLVEVAA